jgi:hypothetical protein
LVAGNSHRWPRENELRWLGKLQALILSISAAVLAQASNAAEREVGNFMIVAVMGVIVVAPTIFLVLIVMVGRRGGRDDH